MCVVWDFGYTFFSLINRIRWRQCVIVSSFFWCFFRPFVTSDTLLCVWKYWRCRIYHFACSTEEILIQYRRNIPSLQMLYSKILPASKRVNREIETANFSSELLDIVPDEVILIMMVLPHRWQITNPTAHHSGSEQVVSPFTAHLLTLQNWNWTQNAVHWIIDLYF